jgi:SsrA-binding protein
VVKESGKKLIAQNSKAKHDYFVIDAFECGLVLTGTEVKSLRAGRASLTDGFALVRDGEIWLTGVHIPEYNQGSWTNHPPRRERKLLLRKEQIEKLIGKAKEGGTTLVPLSLYFKDGKVKVELALAKGKKSHDKRSALMEKQAKREVDREISQRSTGKSQKASPRYED